MQIYRLDQRGVFKGLVPYWILDEAGARRAAMAQASALSWRPFGDIIRASAKLNWPLASPIRVFHLIKSEIQANKHKYFIFKIAINEEI